MMKTFVELNKKAVNDSIAYWQQVLGLTDWYIATIFEEPSDECDSYADVNYAECGKFAVIHMSHPESHKKRKDSIYIPEKTIIHELLHLKFSLLDPTVSSNNCTEESLEYRVLHQIIDDMAKSLLAAKRGEAKFQWKNTEEEQARFFVVTEIKTDD
jgi:hypothetical protein